MKTTAEDKLLALGLQKLKSVGVRGLKLRRLCAEAGVSPGTFTSYFKTMGQYKERLLTLWYEPLCEAVHQQRVLPEGDELAHLRATLRETALFFRRNAGEVVQLFMDVNAGESSVQRLLRAAQLHHILWLKEAIAEAQQAGQIVDAPAEQVLFYLFGGTNFTTFVYHLFLPNPLPDTRNFTDMLERLVDEASILQRLEWTLKGITCSMKGDPA